jgi:hypothetical protein
MTATNFFRAYLVSWLFVWNLALGSLALVTIHQLTGGAWGLAVRRALEAQMRTLPLVALMFIPIAVGRAYIFSWAESPAVYQPRFRALYLRPELAGGRAVVYFTLWIGLAWLLSAWSRQEDQREAAPLRLRDQNLSGIGLVIYGVTLHFASIDWLMSLEPGFTSTIFGPIVAACQLASAFAMALILFASTASRVEFAGLISGPLLNDLGNLLLTFVLAWAYLVWCQFMLIWIGDLPRDNVWWLARSRGFWLYVGGGLILFHFVVPFYLLLFRAVKRNVRALATVAALVLVMQFVFVNYQVWPAFGDSPTAAWWIEALVPGGVGGVWLAVVLWLYGQRLPAPLNDRSRHHARELLRMEQRELAREEAAHGR